MTVTPEGSPEARDDAVTRRWRTGGRAGVALALSLAAVAFAAVAAVGPAVEQRATYSWPPPDLPSAQPREQWYAPLPLTRHVPHSLDATVPCGEARALPSAARPFTLVATTRQRATGGLAVTRSGDRLTFSIGTDEFASLDVPAEQGANACTARLHIEDDNWSLAAPWTAVEGELEDRLPVVTGFFSGVDLRAGPGPSIAVTTEPFGARPTAVQKAAWILAALLALGALVLATGLGRGRMSGRTVGDSIVSAGKAVRPVDGFVAALLLTWWVVGPVLFDDGWVKVRQTNYDAAGGFSNYYTTLGANLPLDFWLEWLQHWVVASFDTLLVLRLPALGLLAATWVVCRWALARLLATPGPGSTGAEWALGIAFTLGALAWAVTLRPEPVVALLLTGVLACAIRFVERPGAAPLALASALVALALSAHPAGLVSLAPLIVISPRLLAWARAERWLRPATIVLAALALLLVLATVGSDLPQRLDDARLARTVGDAVAGWREELSRYEFRGAEATTLRRGSVALMLVALLAYLLRAERRSRLPLDLPAASLGVALVLLVPTPSKWAWHFGALAGLVALAVAAEVVRLRRGDASRSVVRPLIATLAVVLVIGWSWSPRQNWSTGLDLRTYDWMLTIEDRVPLVRLMSASPLLALGAAMIVALAVRGRARARLLPWQFVSWLVPLAVLPLVAFNLAVFVKDAAETPAWSLTRQNLSSLVGRPDCGLAEDLRVARPESARALAPVGRARPPMRAPWTDAAPMPGLATFSLLAQGRTAVTTPWYPRPAAGRRVGFFVTSAIGAGDAVAVRWGSSMGAAVRPGEWVGVNVAAARGSEGEPTIEWTFVPEGLLGIPPPGANLVQLSVHSAGVPPRALAVTGAVAYRSAPLKDMLRAPETPSLVWPNLVLYMPCARLPRLQRGVVEIPTLLVAHNELWPIDGGSSPFRGTLDVYKLRDLSVGDSRLPPAGIHVLWVDREIPGAVRADVAYRVER